MLEYRAEIALWALSGVLPLIMLGVWSGSGAAAAAGLSPQQLSQYFLAAFVVRQFTVVWLIQVFEDDALQGRLSPFLLQPLSPLWRYLAAHFSEQASRIPFVAVMLLVVGLAAPGLLWLPSAGALLLGILAIVAAFLLRFLLQVLVTTLCFWSERAAALDRLLMIPYLFLSGIVAPLETFPPAVRRLALATPFPWMVDFPARLLAGEPVNVALGFGAIAAWCLLLLPIGHWLWRAGLRRYSAMGA
ncbi:MULTISPECIES: ABC-2 family transporter protein [Cyanobium]|uniref:Multidrug ABC transporter permease n=1 Tax=Cyanobium usitatum str. Tous TaxID=2116684 RepID=A0A2P7N2D6_9CYAN|nr:MULTISPECIES: ABC-2 family transporter protein [Cyanobium]MCP9779824.1 ABC-2 family transporter protein [Cyanobium sp. To12R1]PSJ07551.1 multidrug ABC transporter permease [Cyanobium usitatum str. Tous]